MLDVSTIRRQFPALQRTLEAGPAIYFDGPAGSQVPQSVADAMADTLLHHNANSHGLFVTSRETDALLERAGRAVADLVGAEDPREIVFGANMTTMTFSLSRALARNWGPGDEIIVTELDHDANVAPWIAAARDRGATVRVARVRPEDCTLDVDDLLGKLSTRTRLVALGAASNASGSINPIGQIAAAAHDVGAEIFVDAVHFAPHARIDVQAWNCDYLACSAYKFFGPHVGLLWGRAARMAQLSPYKVRPAPEVLPDRWMTGTQNFEGIAGTVAAIDYLAGLGGPAEMDRPAALDAAYKQISEYESNLLGKLLGGLAELPEIRVYGIVETNRIAERLPTISLSHARHTPRAVAQYLAERGVFVWHGNYYALSLTEALGLEPDGMVRIGLLHYNTLEEVSRLLELLAAL